ncbi:MAG: hypothetical protein ACLFVO_29575 [Chloroflexaceae bacterium]
MEGGIEKVNYFGVAADKMTPFSVIQEKRVKEKSGFYAENGVKPIIPWRTLDGEDF